MIIYVELSRILLLICILTMVVTVLSCYLKAIFYNLIDKLVCFRVENDVKLLRNRVRMLQMEH